MNDAPFACAPCHVISIDRHWQDRWKQERNNDQFSQPFPVRPEQMLDVIGAFEAVVAPLDTGRPVKL